MVNKNYRIGYNFERRVKKVLEKAGCIVFRQGKSKFPDLICIIKKGHIVVIEGQMFVTFGWGQCFIVECKVNKYLDAKEKAEAKELAKHVNFFVAYRKNRKIKFYQVE